MRGRGRNDLVVDTDDSVVSAVSTSDIVRVLGVCVSVRVNLIPTLRRRHKQL